MKEFLFSLSITLYTISAFAQLNMVPEKEIPASYGYKVKIGQQIPHIELELTDGTKVSSTDFRGKVTMLQFTASWCSVCRKEMPHIEKQIWQKHKNNNKFVLIGVDMDEPLETVKDFKETMRITYPLALDPDAKIFYTFAAKGAGVTRNVIIDKTGKIVYMTRLFEKEEFNEMVEVIDFLLKE